MATYYNNISSQEKLIREYRLLVQDRDANGHPVDSAIEIKNPITIRFSVNRNLFADVNSLDVDIYNLAPNTYNKLFYDYYSTDRDHIRTIVLEAGYKGQELSTIFIGDMWSCYTSRQGSDIITRIHAFMGLNAMQAQTDLTLSQISRNQILRAAAKDMALDIDIYSGEDTQFTRPVSLSGNSMGIIQKYSGDNAFIDNNKIKVLENQDAIQGSVVLINDKAGLLGAPQRENALLTVKIIFEPRIVIGQIIEIQSRIMAQFDGQYKVWGIRHEGTISDAVSGDCTTTLEMLVGSQVYGRFNVKAEQ